jgi:hypothetical protein
MGATMNLLICRCFDGKLQKTVNLSRIAAKRGSGFTAKDFTGELFFRR